ncbi:MAG: hypothetical protein JNK81_07630, partial [Anaerolineales bacterium]|nr:hypothetical protein [Anaerolineales bacterium]
ENEANQMMDEIESQVRERLGSIVFGVDEDTLEEVTLNLLAKKGLTLTAIESGLNGLLARKIPHTASIPDLTADSLLEALRSAQASAKTDVAVGVTIFPEERSAVMAMITPKGEKSHKITYGGPPKSLPRWSMYLVINWLRTAVEEME